METLKIINAADNADILDYFKSKGFNIKKEWRKLKINPKDQDLIMESILIELKSLIESNGIRSHIQSGEISSVCIVKLRVKNPMQNNSKSSGFRTYSLFIADESTAILFDIYPKNGTNRKDNISDTEKNKMQEIVNDFKC